MIFLQGFFPYLGRGQTALEEKIKIKKGLAIYWDVR
jgi:hypothetical protein